MRRSVAGMLCGLWLAGCGEEPAGPTTADYEAARQQKLQTGLAGKRKPPVRPEESADVIAQGNVEKGYVYDATGKRDPFRSFVLEEAARKNKGERGPLEQFELGQLALQAVVWGTDKPRALVTDPQGRGYIVKEGTPIGKSSGEVTQIGADMVVVREIYEDTTGVRTEKNIEMRIRQSQGG